MLTESPQRAKEEKLLPLYAYASYCLFAFVRDDSWLFVSVLFPRLTSYLDPY